MASMNLSANISLLVLLNIVLSMFTAMAWGADISTITNDLGNTLSEKSTGFVNDISDWTHIDFASVPVVGGILYSFQGAVNMAILGIKIIGLVIGGIFTLPIALAVSKSEPVFLQFLGYIGYMILMWFNIHSFMALKSWWGGSKQ